MAWKSPFLQTHLLILMHPEIEEPPARETPMPRYSNGEADGVGRSVWTASASKFRIVACEEETLKLLSSLHLLFGDTTSVCFTYSHSTKS